MADEATPEPGWYAVLHNGKFVRPVLRTNDGFFVFETCSQDFTRDWPFMVYTIGPRIDDLLRDAARLNWLIEHQRIGLRGESPKEIRQAIDAEIAREKPNG